MSAFPEGSRGITIAGLRPLSDGVPPEPAFHVSAARPAHRAGARGIREEWLVALESARRAIPVRIAGEQRWLSIEDAGRVRDALGAALPVGVPETFTEPVADTSRGRSWSAACAGSSTPNAPST